MKPLNPAPLARRRVFRGRKPVIETIKATNCLG